MTIKEVEEQTGLARSNIRFCERENLFHPERTNNGYRNYSETDVVLIRKIAYLRTVGVSIEDIQAVIRREKSLKSVISIRHQMIATEMSELENAYELCEKMLQEESVDFDNLNVEKYIANQDTYWRENKKVFRLDSVGFFYLWGKAIIWLAITVFCMIIAIVTFPFLPTELPVQWNQGEVSSTVHKGFIFIYPVICILLRYLLRPFIWRALWQHGLQNDALTDYIVNFLCFLALTIQIFTLLFLKGIVHNAAILVVADILAFSMVIVWATNRNKRT